MRPCSLPARAGPDRERRVAWQLVPAGSIPIVLRRHGACIATQPANSWTGDDCMRRFKRCLALSVPALLLLGGLGTVGRQDVDPDGRGCSGRAAQAARGRPDQSRRLSLAGLQAGLIKDEPLPVAVPTGLQPLTPKVVVPAANPMTKGKDELGKQLYFDPRVSLDGTVSCATCHNPAKGWTDGAPGVGRHRRPDRQPERPDGAQHGLRQDDVLGRPRPVAGRPGPGPIQNPIEMGKQTYKEIVDRLRTIPGYTRAVPEGLRHRRHARRHGQGDRHVRAGRRPVGQLGLRQVQRGRQRRP